MKRFINYLPLGVSTAVISLFGGYLLPIFAEGITQEPYDQLSLPSLSNSYIIPVLTSDNAVISLPKSDRLADVQTHWANSFITSLVNRNLLSLSSSNTFNPNGSITRAELAVILQQAFIYQATYRQPIEFEDVPSTYWAAEAIKKAYVSGFLSGYSNKLFRPEQNVTRAQAMVAIANGLDLISDPSRSNRDFIVSLYRDGDDIPDYAVDSVAKLSDRQIIVNYPEPRTVNPQKQITRAELAALIYQALVYQGRLPKISSQYIIDPRLPLFNLAAGQITKLEINLSQRQVTAYQGDKKLKTYPVAVGRAGWETPTGTYQVKQMVKNPAWKNPFTGDVIKSGDPDNPLGNYWIGFWTNGKDWSGFHGTPNRESVGQAASHGCIRMYAEDIQELFNKVTPETIVRVIH